MDKKAIPLFLASILCLPILAGCTQSTAENESTKETAGITVVDRGALVYEVMTGIQKPSDQYWEEKAYRNY